MHTRAHLHSHTHSRAYTHIHTGKLMLAHAASAQGISVVETMCGRDNVLNHLSVPAACFTHPEVKPRGAPRPGAA